MAGGIQMDILLYLPGVQSLVQEEDLSWAFSK